MIYSKTQYTKGQRYRVDGEYAHNPVICTVEHVARRDDLPEIAGAPPVEEIRAILDEFGIEQVLTMSFQDRFDTLIFSALVCRDGTIRDLHKQKLTFEELA